MVNELKVEQSIRKEIKKHNCVPQHLVGENGKLKCLVNYEILPHRIHGTGIFPYMKTIKINHVYVNIPYMDPMGTYLEDHPS